MTYKLLISIAIMLYDNTSINEEDGKETFKDFEVIVINDGTPDKSMDIVKNYDVKVIEQKNQGQSAARNNGIKKAPIPPSDHLEREVASVRYRCFLFYFTS